MKSLAELFVLILSLPYGIKGIIFSRKQCCILQFKTIYREDFSVASKANASNFAYTRSFLQLHTDLPYYEYMPGVRTKRLSVDLYNVLLIFL